MIVHVPVSRRQTQFHVFGQMIPVKKYRLDAKQRYGVQYVFFRHFLPEFYFARLVKQYQLFYRHGAGIKCIAKVQQDGRHLRTYVVSFFGNYKNQQIRIQIIPHLITARMSIISKTGLSFFSQNRAILDFFAGWSFPFSFGLFLCAISFVFIFLCFWVQIYSFFAKLSIVFGR
jgi:hypothetical protein